MGLIAPEAKRSEVLLGGGAAQSAAVQGLSGIEIHGSHDVGRGDDPGLQGV